MKLQFNGQELAVSQFNIRDGRDGNTAIAVTVEDGISREEVVQIMSSYVDAFTFVYDTGSATQFSDLPSYNITTQYNKHENGTIRVYLQKDTEA